ncbi:MAG: ABC transporter permease [Synergistaceae bacterium]|jgi:ribose transport system permease protein|nr:ABC transporter permease [Synergistaceae bacterium]
MPTAFVIKKLYFPELKRNLLPWCSILLVFVPVAVLRPRIMNYAGLQLLLNMAMPLSLATVAQMFAMVINETDFSIGSLVGLVTCVTGVLVSKNAFWGISVLLGIVLIYMFAGAMIYLKKLPSIIVTIGLSFVWTGLATTLQPAPGGNIPEPLVRLLATKTPLIPFPVFFMVSLALLGYGIVFKTRFGILVRGTGGNARAILQAGHSCFKVYVMVFGLVGFFGILAGLALAGVTTSADANMAKNYTLFSVAGVVLGGGSFSGGRVSPLGAVLGACTMTLVGTLLTFLKIRPDWQIGAQGMIILVVLLINRFIKNAGKVNYV